MTDPPTGALPIHLPRPVRLRLENFSLYSNASTIDAVFGDGVFCLAGANGLGKSTFLSALNFALTGVVADPNRRFDSVREYYRHSISYSEDYFRGRISAKDREVAEVSVEFLLGARRYQVTRGMFDPVALRRLAIGNAEEMNPSMLSDTEDPGELHARYVSSFLSDSRLETFAQFVFLQHYLLTFDERRHLLFWDDRVAQAALFMAFQVDTEVADRADQLRRNVERADSLARNLQWQATDTKNKLKELESARAELAEDGSLSDPDLAKLTAEVEAATLALRTTSDAAREERLRIAELSAAEADARRAYDAKFAATFVGRRPSASHPVVEEALRMDRCGLCGSRDADVAQMVRDCLDSGVCPFCGSDDRSSETPDTSDLEELALMVSDLSGRIEVSRNELERLEKEAESRQAALADLSEQVVAIEEATGLEIGLEGIGDRSVEAIVRRYRAQIAELLERKKAERARRDRSKRELKRLQDQLAISYSVAEQQFVPEFSDLARSFLGLDLDIELARQSGSMQLILTVESTRRRVHEALSESQRFFVDIALRMALARQIVSRSSPVCLYIDTPEGSLDIAYESRAGAMFAEFVRHGDQMVITANINTSQLLQRLASECGVARMSLLRMTDWTNLSEVQAEEEELFDQAYDAIESALAAGGDT